MNKKFVLRSLFSAIALGAIVVQSAGLASAQEAQPAPPPPPPPQFEVQAPPPPPPALNTAGRSKISVMGAFGLGFNSVDIGTTTDGEDVKISGGGGAGLGLGLGFGLTPDLDLDFDLGGQVSILTPAVSNADGTFARSYLLATIKHKMPISDSGQFKFGIGLGAYGSGELDVDLRDAGGPHDIVKYDDALGFHVTGEFERFIGPSTSFHVGAKMYFVKYKAKSWTEDGASVPVGNLKSEVKDFDGNGLDFMIGLSQYF